MTIPTSPPAEALTYGFDQLLFADDFTDISTIDLSNTKALGFNWYVAEFLDLTGGMNPGDVTVSNSLLTITGSSTSSIYRSRINSAGYLGNKQYVGRTFSGANGFYVEASFAFDPTKAVTTANAGWPAFWLTDVLLRMNQTNPYVGGYKGNEMDIFEALPTGAGTINPIMFDHDWGSSSSGYGAITADSGGALGGSPTFTNQNTYGTLVVPMAKNGGTGFFHRYFNGSHVSALDQTWTAGADFSCIETSNFYIVISGAYQWPMICDYIAIWGPPTKRRFQARI